MSSEGVPEIKLCLVSPPERRAVAALSSPNIKISAGAVADIVDELIGPALAVLVGVSAVLGLREGEVALSLRFGHAQLMNFVLGEQSSVVVADVGVPACAVGSVVDHLALGRDDSVRLHLIKLLGN